MIIGLFLNIHYGIAYASEDDDKDSHHHHISVFGGYSSDLSGKGGYKLGIEYEYKVSKIVGLGGTFDFTGADFSIFSYSVGADFYLFDFPLVLGVAGGAKNHHRKWDPFFRALAIYDFHVGNFSIGPLLMYDVYSGDKNIISFGASVGISLH